jgi:Cu/Ag efflux protein CusF
MFDFIKKIFEDKEVKVEKEKIEFSEIGNQIDKRSKDLEVKESKVFILIQEKTSAFINELKEKTNVVEGVDLKSKKAEERLESASETGREKYLESVEVFIESLNLLERNNLEKFSKNIDRIFLDFNKSSHMNYERATILIGKEMADVKTTIKIFSRELIKIFEENKDIVDHPKTFTLIKLKLNEIEEINEELEKIKAEQTNGTKDLLEKEEENKRILNEIEEIKKTEDYIVNLERQNKIKLLEEDLKREILGLKQIIDFKALANFYHIFEDKMELVKKYRDDFQGIFEKDNGETILESLLDESKLNNRAIADKMEKIKTKKGEIMKNKQEVKSDKTQELYNQTIKVILDIGNLKNGKTRQEKRREKLRFMKEGLIKSVKEKTSEHFSLD